MVNEFVAHLRKKRKILFITTSNRWEGDNEVPKSTQLAKDLAIELEKTGSSVTLIDVSKIKLYPCEGNVSTLKGNSCGLKDSVLKDDEKNPTGFHRCWASVNNPDDELWKISKALFESQAVVFFISVRWGQTNAFYQKLIERLNWIENRHTSLGEDNIVKDIEAGCVVIGQNWRGAEVVEIQKEVYNFYGFKVPPQLSFNWQFTMDTDDESLESYLKAPSAFEKFFDIVLKTAKKIKESSKFLKFGSFVNESTKFPHKIHYEPYWRKILGNNDYAQQVLDTIMKKQNGYASDRQMALLRRVESGDTTPYSTKN